MICVDKKLVHTSYLIFNFFLNHAKPIELLDNISVFPKHFGTSVQLHEIREHGKCGPVLIEHDVKLSISLR